MTMNKELLIYSLFIFAMASCDCFSEQARSYPDNWVYVARNLTKDEHVDEIRQIAETSHKHGLNGMLFAAGLEGVERWDEKRIARLNKVKTICDEQKIEIIPLIWSVGYGTCLGLNPNLAEGLPCTDVPFLVKGKEASLIMATNSIIANGGFEEFKNNRMKGYNFHDKPGEVSFADTAVYRNGNASLRFENFGKFDHGHARVMQEAIVIPHRQYRVTCWIKTEQLEPASAFKLQIYGPKGCIAPVDSKIDSTADWKKASLVFNSLQCEKIKIYIGLWGGKSGKLWVDDLSMEELALVNVLRRPGTPVTLKSDDAKTLYEEGKDYEPIGNKKLQFSRPRNDSPAIRLTDNSRIKDGQRLLVSYYHGMAINNGQVSVCMSEPELYEHWTKSAAAIKKHLNPEQWFLSMDEIRAGGSCQACMARNMSMAQILGDCITKQMKIIREVNPTAKVYIWSDMLDPNHNAHGNYYLVNGDFTRSWEYVPKDLVICCWYFKMREESMKFFSNLGFETHAGAYYDGDDLKNINGWIDTINHTPKCRGIMYTTWQNKYKLLPDFGESVKQHSKPMP